MSKASGNDPELSAVAAEIRTLDPDGRQAAQILRDTLDQLYDGQRTGRYRWDQLFKTEKTHCGTLVEINIQRKFKFDDGRKLDYQIAGHEVDCKYSQTLGAWMIPPEVHGHLCLLLWAEDSQRPRWSMGLVRITLDRLNVGSNRDAKSTLNEVGRGSITWLAENAPLPPNVLLQLDRIIVDRIMAQKSGQKRINELFRSAVGRVVGRAVVATVAKQDDYMKRIRLNGGARTLLKPEGILILGQYQSHAAVARALGLPEPGPGDSVSVRVSPAQAPGPGVVEISGSLWKVAKANDRVVPAPDLPVGGGVSST
jgi:hypothetical protein